MQPLLIVSSALVAASSALQSASSSLAAESSALLFDFEDVALLRVELLGSDLDFLGGILISARNHIKTLRRGDLLYESS